ncbi:MULTISPECIES: hypothetical protein [Bradyrhizobium]|uniref:hypothetical protein n=1 Tax=Bradyrhizobium TaxID=374 RepID=UPI00117808F9|nr:MULTISPECIES: hypothetical protein [Bradyrhizobium]WOH61681.1 hypothetical protein RX329_16905 [Bradyrhizobium sp. BWC-3-1]
MRLYLRCRPASRVDRTLSRRERQTLAHLLTLFTTPLVYLYLDRLQQTFGGRPALAQEVASSSTAA